MAEIYDIYNINNASIFPLATGYKALIIAVLLLAIIAIIYKYKNNIKKLFDKKPKWQIHAKKELEKLINKDDNIDISNLYIIIKKIILNKYGRKNTASLSGTEFLVFLQKHDPKNFAWQEEGKFLIASFAPQKIIAKNDPNLQNTIKAIKTWL